MTEQDRVAAFVEANDLGTAPEHRALDLVAEVGEVAAAIEASTDYGDRPEDIAVPSDEIGDVLFSLLALSESLGVDADAALAESLEKYERRLEDSDSPASES